ncbi:MAG: bifunctional folylpolyglutamate synthase/dihydrofolate synthase [Sulfobacillus sp.]
MSVRSTIRRLHSRGRFGELGLERMERLMAKLGEPQDAVPAVHVAGTNGKGSTAAMVEAVWRLAGYRTGLYTSPHLVDWRERIQVSGQRISPRLLAAHLATVERALGQEQDPLTEFEAWTAVAFMHFRHRQVHRAAIEVGLGGRLDATNVLHRPRAAAIVTIGLDHVQRLGGTLDAIAWEKAGVAKAGVPLVVGWLPPQALHVVQERAAQVGAPVILAGRDFTYSGHGAQWQFAGLGRHVRAALSLSGAYQAENAAVATALLLLADPDLGADQIRSGLEVARWPGRTERVSERPQVWLDGAKNPLGTQALRRHLDQVAAGQGVRLVFGCLDERDPAALLAPLADRVEELMLVPIHDVRGLSSAGLVAAAQALGLKGRLGTLRQAARFLLETPDSQVGVGTGSFYLVGPLRRLIGGEQS